MAAPFSLGPVTWGQHGECWVADPNRWVMNPAVGLVQAHWEGCQHGNGWLPIPDPSGKGWKWAGSTPADYNRYFRQSLADASTIQGAPSSVGWMNGLPKFLDLINGEDPRSFGQANPGVRAVVRGWYNGIHWTSDHGGNGQDDKQAVYWRDGEAISQPPPGYTHSNLGFEVIGGLALLAGGIAAAGAIAGSGTAAGAAASGAAETTATTAATAATESVSETVALSAGEEAAASTVAATASTAAAGTSAAAAASGTSIGSILGSASSFVTSVPGLGTVGAAVGGAGKLLSGGGSSMDDFSFGSVGDLITGMASQGLQIAQDVSGQLGNLGHDPNTGSKVAASAKPASSMTPLLVVGGLAALVFLL